MQIHVLKHDTTITFMFFSNISLTFLRRICTFFLLVAITYLSLSPTKGPPSVYLLDYVFHAIAYAALSTPYSFTEKPKKLYIFTGACIWGIAIELIQPYVGRTCDFYDVCANSTGILIAIFVAPKLYALFFASSSTGQKK